MKIILFVCSMVVVSEKQTAASALLQATIAVSAKASTSVVSAKASTPVSSKASTPVSSKASTPVSSKASTPVSAKASTPVSSKASTPVSSKASTPVSSKASTPVSSKASTPVSSKASTPVSAKASTPVSAKASTPVSAKASTPVSAKASTPVSSKASTSVPSSTIATQILLSTSATLKATQPLTTSKATRTPVQGPHHHPIYRYSCNEDLSVTFKGVNGIIKIVSDTKNNTGCKTTNITSHNGSFKITKECLSSTNFNESRWMEVAVYDNNENEAYISPTTTRIPYLVTGHHVFNLTCLPLKEAGVDRIALAETGITDTEQLHNVYNEIGQVEMRFKEDESIDKPDVSTVYIGDRFYMYLKYMGDTTHYVIVPQTCTAYQGTYRSGAVLFMKLWTQNSNISQSDCTTEDARTYKVMTNFKRLSATIVHAELHGFRFNADGNSGFDDVTISCTVKICTSATGKCKDHCQIGSGRKRRETDEIIGNRQKRSTGRIRSQTVSRTIIVGQTEFKSNEGGRNDVHIGAVAIVIAGIILNKVFH